MKTLEIDYRTRMLEFATNNMNVPELQFIRDDPDGVVISTIDGNGMINYILRVRSPDGAQSVIIKYGEDHYKTKPNAYISLHRQKIEHYGLSLFHEIQNGSVPRPYCHDSELNFIAMEDLGTIQLLADDICRGHVDVNLTSNLGHLLAKLHNATWLEDLPLEKAAEMRHIFGDMELRERSRLGRTLPLEASEMELGDPLLHNVFEELRQGGVVNAVNDLYNTELCLIHNDLHSKAIMYSRQRLSIIDTELAAFGHPAFDLAYIIAYYLMAQFSDIVNTQTLQAITALLNAYCEGAKITKTDEDKKRFMSALVAFTGTTLLLNYHYPMIDLYLGKLDESDHLAMLETGVALNRAFMLKSCETIQDFTNLLQFH